jgi:hypothetical protein
MNLTTNKWINIWQNQMLQKHTFGKTYIYKNTHLERKQKT